MKTSKNTYVPCPELRGDLQILVNTWYARSCGNTKNRDEVIVKHLWREASEELARVLTKIRGEV